MINAFGEWSSKHCSRANTEANWSNILSIFNCCAVFRRNNNERTEVQSECRIHWEINEIILQSNAHMMAAHGVLHVELSAIYSPPTTTTTATTDRDQWISFSNISFSWCVGCVECVVAIPRLISLKFDSGRFYWIVRFNQFISYFHFQFRAKCVVQTFARFCLAPMWCQPVNACCSFCSSSVLWFSENIIAPFTASA